MSDRSGGDPTQSTEADRSVAERKVALRAELRRRLERVSPEEAQRAAAVVAERALELPELAGAASVLACLSFGTEIDTWALVDRLLDSGREIWVPRADPRDRQLHLHHWPCALETVSFGLRQPPRGTPELAPERIGATIDAVLVLGLAFDRSGFRLGHGSGYFDRFLARHPLPAVGLSFDFQLLDVLPTALHDLPMSVVVTDRRVVRRPAAAATESES